MRRYSPALFARASRQLSVFMSIVIFLVLTAGAVAVAQTVDTAPLPAGATTETTTVIGWILKALLGATAIAVAFAAVKLSGFLNAKTQETGQSMTKQALWGAVNTLWLKTQAIGSKIFQKDRALIEKILSDGKVTHEEVQQLSAAILADLQEVAGQEIPIIKSLLVGGSQGGLQTMLTGWATAVAHKLLGVTDSAPTNSPTSANPAPKPEIAVAPSSPT